MILLLLMIPLPLKCIVLQLLIDYCLHELPTEIISSCDYHDDDTFVVDGACCSTSVPAPAEETQGPVHAALTAHIEFLEAKNKSLTQQLVLPKAPFRLAECWSKNQNLLSGFTHTAYNYTYIHYPNISVVLQ